MTSQDNNAAKDIADRVGEASKTARSEADTAVSKAGGAAREFAARAGTATADLYSQVQDRMSDALDNFPDGAADAVASGRKAYARGSDAVGRHVAKQPIEALLLAGAIGYLVGWAANRG